MSHVPALVTPLVLAWARETAGYTAEEVAQRLRVTPQQVQGWEDGSAQPMMGQARKLAALYGRPLAVFYLPSPPKTRVPPRDYRRVQVSRGGLSPRLRREIRKALYRRDMALEIMEALEEEPTAFQLQGGMNEPSELLAQRLRSAIGVSIETQARWRGASKALRAWSKAVEDLGILVFQTRPGVWGVPEDEMWGASIYESVLPVVLLNARTASQARIFTLMHELTHLALRTSGICDMGEEERIEVYCNRVAGEVLVPTTNLVADLEMYDASALPVDEQIERLARRYSVSTEVVARRLLIVGRVSRSFYLEKRAEYQRRRQQKREADKALGKPVPTRQDRVILKSNGVRYTGIVLDAYHSRTISLGQVSRYLDMNLKYFAGVQEGLLASR